MIEHALVLNATYQPITVVPAKRAVVLVYKEKADMVETNGAKYRSEVLDMEAPSVIRLRHYVQVPFRSIPLTRRGVFARDEWTCQYCGAEAENLDHVVPKAKKGPHSWTNIVASCKRCNDKKGDKSLKESGMTLKRKPQVPSGSVWLTMRRGSPDEWQAYLGA